uniref:NADH-ubiquinone oxidoreductase chain 2 n=1 Tax=Siphonosoma cumanense TaxID=6444 RepID=A0A7D4VN42_SIPCU|nr:NADH dehydrogenase subunit 2 [Siphonosoma cumanense]QKS32604.1 NADH dehydrogenase subunit 2 [Siphonosoma cumanense]
MLILMPYSSLFFFFLFTSVIMVLASPNWFMAWMAMELNLLSFIPLLTSSKSMQETESSVKYFFAQGVGSALILMGAFYNFNFASFFILIGLLFKLGAAPFHLWFPSAMSGISWNSCILMSTWQKIAPLSLLTTLSQSWPLLILSSAALSALMGGLMGINQSYLRALLAYSSITHTGWMLALITQSYPIMISYFLIYSIISVSIMMSLNNSNALSLSFFTSYPLLMFLQLLSLGGLPPLTGFAAKLLSLSYLAPFSLPLSLILILGSLLGLYYYLTMTFSILYSSFLYPKISYSPLSLNLSFLTTLSLSLFLTFTIFIP